MFRRGNHSPREREVGKYPSRNPNRRSSYRKSNRRSPSRNSNRRSPSHKSNRRSPSDYFESQVFRGSYGRNEHELLSHHLERNKSPSYRFGRSRSRSRSPLYSQQFPSYHVGTHRSPSPYNNLTDRSSPHLYFRSSSPPYNLKRGDSPAHYYRDESPSHSHRDRSPSLTPSNYSRRYEDTPTNPYHSAPHYTNASLRRSKSQSPLSEYNGDTRYSNEVVGSPSHSLGQVEYNNYSVEQQHHKPLPELKYDQHTRYHDKAVEYSSHSAKQVEYDNYFVEQQHQEPLPELRYDVDTRYRTVESPSHSLRQVDYDYSMAKQHDNALPKLKYDVEYDYSVGKHKPPLLELPRYLDRAFASPSHSSKQVEYDNYSSVVQQRHEPLPELRHDEHSGYLDRAVKSTSHSWEYDRYCVEQQHHNERQHVEENFMSLIQPHQTDMCYPQLNNNERIDLDIRDSSHIPPRERESLSRSISEIDSDIPDEEEEPEPQSGRYARLRRLGQLIQSRLPEGLLELIKRKRKEKELNQTGLDEQEQSLKLEENQCIKVCIAHSKHPDVKLTKIQRRVIRRELSRAISRMREDEPQIHCQSWSVHSGMLILSCADLTTAQWIEEMITTQTWSDVKLISVQIREPKSRFCEVYLPDDCSLKGVGHIQLTEEQVLKRLGRMNRVLHTQMWVAVNRENANAGQVWTFSVDDNSMRNLEMMGYRPYFGFGRVKFKPMADLEHL